MTQGRKVAPKVPIFFDEVYLFQPTTPGAMGDLPDYEVYTVPNEIYPECRSALSLPGMINWSMKPGEDGLYPRIMNHVKGMDSGGEDGNFEKRVKIAEEIDAALPKLMKLKPDVLAITGDHSTPAMLASHSWHPVPVLIHSEYVRHSGAASFCERECEHGNLGRLASVHVLPIMLGNAKRLKKFGA